MIDVLPSHIPAVSAFAGLDDRLRVCVELLVAGVAFQTDSRTWEVTSHDGAHIGTMSTYWVGATICAMKKQGWRATSVTNAAQGEQHSVTFGHRRRNVRHMSAADWECLMARRHRGFVTIH